MLEVSLPKPPKETSPFSLLPCLTRENNSKEIPDEFRTIHYRSHPKGSSLSDVIPPELCSVHHLTMYLTIRVCVAVESNGDVCHPVTLYPTDSISSTFYSPGFRFDGFYTLPHDGRACAPFETFKTFHECVSR